MKKQLTINIELKLKEDEYKDFDIKTIKLENIEYDKIESRKDTPSGEKIDELSKWIRISGIERDNLYKDVLLKADFLEEEIYLGNIDGAKATYQKYLKEAESRIDKK